MIKYLINKICRPVIENAAKKESTALTAQLRERIELLEMRVGDLDSSLVRLCLDMYSNRKDEESPVK